MAEGMIEPTADIAWVNSVLNHPSVRPWIADMGEGEIDVSEQMAQPNVMALRGEHGLFMVYRLDSGIYEVHTAILPDGRGAWAREFGRAGSAFMFTRTDCVEILTRVPRPHEAARRLTIDMGFRIQWLTLPETQFRGKPEPVEVYGLTLQDWAILAPGMYEAGRAFHEWLNQQVDPEAGTPHPDDSCHNRVVGVALAMIRGGMVRKGIVWYNRWAVVSRHPMIAVVGTSPLQIRFDAGILEMTAHGGIRYAPRH